jgi:hypothetical protein
MYSYFSQEITVRAQGAATGYDDLQIAVLMEWTEYKEHTHTHAKKKYRVSVVKCNLIYSLYFIKITSLKWSPWHAIHTN